MKPGACGTCGQCVATWMVQPPQRRVCWRGCGVVSQGSSVPVLGTMSLSLTYDTEGLLTVDSVHCPLQAPLTSVTSPYPQLLMPPNSPIIAQAAPISLHCLLLIISFAEGGNFHSARRNKRCNLFLSTVLSVLHMQNDHFGRVL